MQSREVDGEHLRGEKPVVSEVERFQICGTVRRHTGHPLHPPGGPTLNAYSVCLSLSLHRSGRMSQALSPKLSPTSSEMQAFLCLALPQPHDHA